MSDDCTSVGFSGEGRCIQPAVCSRTTAAGLHRVCFEHFTAAEFHAYTEESANRRADVRAAISNAYYEARNHGQTMEQAADHAADAVMEVFGR